MSEEIDKKDMSRIVQSVLDSQLFCILSTQGEEHDPHLSIVSFARTDGLETVIFATPRGTRKYGNLIRRPRTALFFDNRNNGIEDIEEVYGIEGCGTASEVPAGEAATYREIFVRKYPELTSFVDSETTALMKVSMERYEIVHQFQNVTVLVVG